MKPALLSRKRSTVLLALGGYINTAILVAQSLLLIPLYLKFIGPNLYGLWLTTGGMLSMLGVVNFGIGTMLIQRVANAHSQQKLEKAGAYFLNGVVVYLLIVVIFTIVGLVLSNYLPAIIKISLEESLKVKACFQIAVVAVGLSIINECFRSFSQALLRPLFSIVTAILSRIFGISVTIFLLYKDVGLWAIPIGMLVTELLIFIIGLTQTVLLFRELKTKFKVDFKVVKEYFHIGGTMFLATMGSTLARESDPLLITLIFRPELTAVYVITRKAADIVFHMISVVTGASHSGFSHLVGSGDVNKTKEVVSKLLLIAYLFGLIGFLTYVVMNHSFVSLWVGQQYALQQNIILLIGLAFFANSLRNMIWQLLNGYGDYQYSSKVIFFEGVSKVILTAILLSSHGMIGLPIALLLCSVVSMVILFVKLQTHIKLAVSTWQIFYSVVVTLILFVISGLFANKLQLVTWSLFALFTAAVLITVSIICVFSNWGLFKSIRGNRK